MAVQLNVYQPMGAVEVFPDTSYTAANITSAAKVVRLLKGIQILDEKGEETRLRGVRMVITNNETAATTPIPNVPYIWYEGDFLYFAAGYSYKFLDKGLVGYGKEVTV